MGRGEALHVRRAQGHRLFPALPLTAAQGPAGPPLFACDLHTCLKGQARCPLARVGASGLPL